MHVCTQGANIETTYLYASCSRGIFFRFRRLWYTAKTSDWMFREGEKRSSSRGELVPRSFCTNSKGRFALTSRTVYTQSTKIMQEMTTASLLQHLHRFLSSEVIYRQTNLHEQLTMQLTDKLRRCFIATVLISEPW